MIIYTATNKINRLIYVGKTSQTLKARIKDHRTCIAKGNRQYFINALRKYGIEGFLWKIVCNVSLASLLSEKEIYWIAKLNTFKGPGYNLTSGGEGTSGYKYTLAQKMRLKGKQTGNKNLMYGRFGKDNPNYGSKRTIDQKKNISAGLKGKGAGENNPRAKLTWKLVREIREIHKKTIKRNGIVIMLAKKYNVSLGTIKSILTCRNWKEVPSC
jgi:group I intron endonuclease